MSEVQRLETIVDRFWWAADWTQVTSAAMALAQHVDARLTALEAKPQAPQTASVDWKAKYSDLNEMHGVLRREFDQSVLKHLSEVKRLNAKNAMLAADVDTVTRQRDNQEAFIVTLKTDNARLHDEKARITTKLSVLAAASREREVLDAELALRIEEIESVRNDCAVYKTQRDTMATQLDYLRKDNERLTAENARLRTENDILRRDYGIKRRQYDEVQAALKAMQDDMR